MSGDVDENAVMMLVNEDDDPCVGIEGEFLIGAKEGQALVFQEHLRDDSTPLERNAIFFHSVYEMAIAFFVNKKTNGADWAARMFRVARARADYLCLTLTKDDHNFINALIAFWSDKTFANNVLPHTIALQNSVRRIINNEENINTNTFVDVTWQKPNIVQKGTTRTDLDPKTAAALLAIFKSGKPNGPPDKQRFYLLMIGVYILIEQFSCAAQMADIGYWETITDDEWQKLCGAPPPVKLTEPTVPKKQPVPLQPQAARRAVGGGGGRAVPVVVPVVVPPPPAPGQGGGGAPAVVPAQQAPARGSGGQQPAQLPAPIARPVQPPPQPQLPPPPPPSPVLGRGAAPVPVVQPVVQPQQRPFQLPPARQPQGAPINPSPSPAQPVVFPPPPPLGGPPVGYGHVVLPGSQGPGPQQGVMGVPVPGVPGSNYVPLPALNKMILFGSHECEIAVDPPVWFEEEK
jgi:hypothetical protein